MQDDPAYVRQAFAAGANGYLLKEAADAELVEAIHDVAAGRRYLHPVLGARLAAAEATAATDAVGDPLSEREHEVLRLLALGHTNQEIAKQLFISVRTVETHRARIVQKLRLKSRAELVRYALATGVLVLDETLTHSHEQRQLREAVMGMFFTIVVLVLVAAVVLVIGLALIEMSPFGRHRDHYRDPRTGERTAHAPNLEDWH